MYGLMLQGRSLRLVLNRPAKLNALSMSMIDLLAEAFATVINRGGIDVIILEGAGPKAFCAG